MIKNLIVLLFLLIAYSAQAFIDPSTIPLNDLKDINAGSPSDGQVLTWDSGTSKWINEAPSAGSSISDGTSNVSIGSTNGPITATSNGNLGMTIATNAGITWGERSDGLGAAHIYIKDGGGTGAELYLDASDDLLLLNATSGADIMFQTNGGGTYISDGTYSGLVRFGCTRTTTNCGASSCNQACATGKVISGGGCSVSPGGAKFYSNAPSTNTNWACLLDGSGTNISAYAICCYE